MFIIQVHSKILYVLGSRVFFFWWKSVKFGSRDAHPSTTTFVGDRKLKIYNAKSGVYVTNDSHTVKNPDVKSKTKIQ